MLRLIEGGKEPLEKGYEVTVDGRGARVVCASSATHVYRDMVSVEYGDGELDLVERQRVQRANAGKAQQ